MTAILPLCDYLFFVTTQTNVNLRLPECPIFLTYIRASFPEETIITAGKKQNLVRHSRYRPQEFKLLANTVLY